MASGIDEGTINTVMPAHEEALVLARLQVAAVGGMLDLDVDQIADLRLATEELCLLVLSQPRDRRSDLHLTVHWDESSIGVSSVVDAVDVTDDKVRDAPGGLSLQILAALTDEHGVDELAVGGRRAWFRKKRSPS